MTPHRDGHGLGLGEEEDPEVDGLFSPEDPSVGSEISDSSDGQNDDVDLHRPSRSQSSLALGLSNSFAPPFYNRPPTPLPPSPSLTSLLRPPFSTTPSRPSTPDSSDVETPNETEAAVAKSARTATTVPRVSPKVPTYEYYGFVLYLVSSLAFRTLFMRLCAQRCKLTRFVYSDLSTLVLPPLTILASIGHLLLSRSMVVARATSISGHDGRVHLRRLGLVQHDISHAPHDQH